MRQESECGLRAIRVVVLDDHPLVASGLKLNLDVEPDIEVVGTFHASRALMAAMRRSPCDVLLADYLLGENEPDGALLIEHLHALFPALRILVCSVHLSPAVVCACLDAGASGFFAKSSSLLELAPAVRAAARGVLYLSSEVRRMVARRFEVSRQAGMPPPLARLTLKEFEVVRCSLQGLSPTQIATKFSRSVKTISGHKITAFRKLGADSDAALFRMRKQLEGL